MDIKELYKGLERVLDKGGIGDAYSGCVSMEDEDNGVLDCFFEYVSEKYGDFMPPWAEAFIQIYSWQFQSIHEGDSVYYTNGYGISDSETIYRTADYLHKNGYHEIEKLYVSPMKMYCPVMIGLEKEPTDCLPDVRAEEHMKIVWRFYVDILQEYKEELILDKGCTN